jgi:hypothetical protein
LAKWAVWQSCFAQTIAVAIKQPVIDKTGIEGKYDFDLRFAAEDAPSDSPDFKFGSIFSAIQEQLGLKLGGPESPVGARTGPRASPVSRVGRTPPPSLKPRASVPGGAVDADAEGSQAHLGILRGADHQRCHTQAVYVNAVRSFAEWCGGHGNGELVAVQSTAPQSPGTFNGRTVSATARYDRDKGLPMTLTIELPDERQAALAAQARAQGVSAEQYARQLLEHALEVTGSPAAARPEEQSSDSRPIWEVMLDNLKDIPPEAFAKLPKDGASEIDHYLYGHPKRNQ